MTDAFAPTSEYEVDPTYEEPVELPEGGLAYKLTDADLTELGARVVSDYEQDESDRADWKDKAERSLERAAQEKLEAKDYPWPGASNVSYPLLTVAALQFQARAYPAIVKNDEAISVKVFGQPAEIDPQLAQMAQQEPQTPEQAAMVEQAQQAVAAFAETATKRKGKLRRARRVAEYLNYKLFYGMPGWEADTDALLLQLPIIGAAFRKSFIDPDTQQPRAAYVSALNLVVPQSATSLETTPRITEVMPEVYPYAIRSRMLAADYMTHDLWAGDLKDHTARTLLEQYRYEDLDGDGLEEPYIITVDKDSAKVLRIEPGWLGEKVAHGRLVGHDRYVPYTLYPFIPDPKGRFYPIGFGHLLDPISDIVNTAINQMVDAGHAQIAGGGFIASGLRLQGAGQTGTLRWRPGEYKTTNVTGGQLRDAIYERTFPQPSAIMFQVLEMMLGAAKDITATTDAITGNAPATAPVGTTLALIEQGLQVFTAIYKRTYRALREEYGALYALVGQYGDPEEYAEVVDDPEADLEADFSGAGYDVVPVSDPTTATKLQQMARAQFLAGFLGKGLNDQEIYKRVFRAADIEDPQDLIPQGPPPEQQQAAQAAAQLAEQDAQAEIEGKRAKALGNIAKADRDMQEARKTALDNGFTEAELAALAGGLSSLAGGPGDPMGPAGAPQFG